MSGGLKIFGAVTDTINQSVNETGAQKESVGNVVQPIVTTVIFVAGIIAVVMVIIGGVQYSTSQGDSAKVKKAKDTIMYGIIGLVIAILAFAIVNFVLDGVF